MQAAAKLIKAAERTAVFTGAGISTESGVPDFRSSTGLYSQNADAMTLLSLSTFHTHPAKFYRFFREAFLRHLDVEPNRAHEVLTRWQQEGTVQTIITQNVDGLHQKSGSVSVLEMHGHLRTAHCLRCQCTVPMDEIVRCTDPYPICPGCDSPLKPDVVLFEENLPQGIFEQALSAVGTADLLIVAGTSLSVSPANYLVDYRNPGGKLLIVNKEPTNYDQTADCVIYGEAGSVFTKLDSILHQD